jgi:ATP-binding cassette, subfamily B, bacterial PglK
MFILNVIKTILKILNSKQQISLCFLSLFLIVSAFVQIVGVASVAPFISLLSSPDSVFSNPVYANIYQTVGARSANQFIIWFAIASLCLILISNLMSALTLWLLFNFSVHIGAQIQSNLFKNYLYREYLYHKSENYNGIISVISQETPRFVYMVLQPFLLLISQILVAIVIIMGLVFLDPTIAISSAALIGGAYFFTYLIVKRSLLNNGKIMSERNRKMQAILSESFIGIKEIKLNHSEHIYTSRLNSINYKGLRASTVVTLLGDAPKYVIETISFGAILGLAILALTKGEAGQGLVSILSIYAIAGYKLLPTMQQVYKSISSISANGSVAYTLYEALTFKTENISRNKIASSNSIETVSLSKVFYQYPEKDGKPGAKIGEITLDFSRGKLYTLAGPSGSGKSTLMDIVLGLIKPSSGTIEFDNQNLNDSNLQIYQTNIGYVAQHVFILDDSVIANVAFGVDSDTIDLNRVKDALTKACALEFVEQLPQGLYTQLGQDGKRLSGGQRQRIAIARALYEKRSILILDEPTSALDIESEHEIMNLLQMLKHQMLIIVVSHRPSAIKLSDQIILLENGEITTQGTYEELLLTNSHFKSLMDKGFGENTNNEKEVVG